MDGTQPVRPSHVYNALKATSVRVRFFHLKGARELPMSNTQMRDGLLARNAQPDSTAQASSSKPAVTGNTQPWEIIPVRHAALDINAPPRMALR